MSQTLAFRIPTSAKWSDLRVDEKAAIHGISRSAFMFLALDTFMGFDDEFLAEMRNYAKIFDEPLHIVIQNFIIDKLAREKGDAFLRRRPNIVHHEFVKVTDKYGTRTMTGKELSKHLTAQYCKQGGKT